MVVPLNWWKGFFSGLFVDLWQAVMSPEQTRAEADCIVKLLRVRPGARLLDVPCGGGRLTVELALRGYELTGVDYSRDFLRRARTLARSSRASVRWLRRDMRRLSFKRPFDGAFCFGNSFGYLDDAGDQAFLKALARVLKPGARVVFDTKCAESVLLQFRERQWFDAGKIKLLEVNHYDLERSRIDTEYTLLAGKRETRRWASERVYTYRELSALLREAGFKPLESFGTISLEPFRVGSERLLVVAVRR